MLNRIIIMGRLTRDPELRRTQNSTAVASFTMAVDRDFKGDDGKRATDFIDIVAWRAVAEFVAKYFTKGRMAIVEGVCSSVTGRTRMATHGAAPKSLPTMCTSATPRETAAQPKTA